jgi:hypothetical protein
MHHRKTRLPRPQHTPRPLLEALEDRRHLSTSTSSRLELSPEGLLSIRGTTGQDTISVGTIKEAIIVNYNGDIIAAFSRLQISSIEIFGLRGTDILSVRDSIRVPALIDGGEGNDSLTGGRGNDLLIGGPGADTIRGGRGNDILVGDDRDDDVLGGDDDDILSPGADKNRIDGGAGLDIFVGRNGQERSVKNIEAEEPASFLPAGRLFPLSVRLAGISAGFTRENGRTIATVKFVLPDSSYQLVTSRLPIPGISRFRQFSALILQDVSVPLTGQPATIIRTFDLGNLNDVNSVSFQISAPEGIVFALPVTRTTNTPLPT